MDTLAEIVERDGPLPVRDAIGWTLRTALAVWLSHDEGVAHGQISLAAVEVASPRCDARGKLRRPRDCPEAPAYHDLERGPAGEPSADDDVWALGVMLYALLTGELPFPEGAYAALEGERPRPAKPLALHDGNLDVMQPILDRLLDPGIPFGARRADEVVGGLRDFSPAIADLPPLDFEPPPKPKGKVAASPGHEGAPASWPTWVWVATVAVPLAFGIALGLRWMDRGDAPVVRRAPPAASSAAASGGAPAGASTAGASTAGASTAGASALPVTPPPASSGASEPLGGPSEDMLACVGAIFDSRSFVAKPVVDFPCRERDARQAEAKVRASLIEATDGQVRPASAEWAGLQWYRLAAVAVLRGRCCASPPPMEGPPLLRLCKLDGALAQLTSAAAQGSDAALASAMDSYRRAIACASAAGGDRMLQVDEKPTAQQAALFVKMLSRLP